MDIHSYPSDMKKVSATVYTCPNCGKRTTFDILESEKYYNYKGTVYEYQGLDACCQKCGHYHMTNELAEMNFSRIRDVIYHSGHPEILKVDVAEVEGVQ